MKTILLCLLLTMCCVGRGQEYRNLSEYVRDSAMIDLGYGLNREDNVLLTDSLFTLNRFIDKTIYFRESKTDSIIATIDAASYALWVKRNRKTGYARSITIYRNNKLVSAYKYPRGSSDWPVGSYLLRCKGNDYFLVMSGANFKASTTTSIYSFVMIDLRSYRAIVPPDGLSTSSLLCLTDYNNDGRPDLILARVRWNDEVLFYQNRNGNWEKDSRYHLSTRSQIDGWLKTIDWKKSNIPPGY